MPVSPTRSPPVETHTSPGPDSATPNILLVSSVLRANPANTPSGTNYSIGGAFVSSGPPGFTAWTNIISLDFSLAPNPADPTTTGQISNYLTSVHGQANPNALYLISTGGNDIFVAPNLGLSMSAADRYFFGEAQALTTSVAGLQAAGARYIIVPDGYIPVSEAGNTTFLNYGTTLRTAVWGDLAASGVHYVLADTASVISAVEQNPLAFGITNPVTSYACLSTAFTRQCLWS